MAEEVAYLELAAYLNAILDHIDGFLTYLGIGRYEIGRHAEDACPEADLPEHSARIELGESLKASELDITIVIKNEMGGNDLKGIKGIC